jgi:hypothetical protein
VPNDWDIGAEDAAEGLENGVCAQRNIVPGEVRGTVAKDYGKTK